MITREQVRAARAYLDWDREKLSHESGVSVPQIANFETGKTESPRQNTLNEIETAFLRNGVGFKNGGIVPKTDCTTRFEGVGWYLRLLDDVYQTLIDYKKNDVVVLYSDESKSSPEVIGQWQKIRNIGATVRRVIRDGDTHILGDLNDYRCLPAEFFSNYIIIVYANKVAICTAGNTMALVIEDSALAKSFTLQTNFYFKVLDMPKESAAHDRP